MNVKPLDPATDAKMRRQLGLDRESWLIQLQQKLEGETGNRLFMPKAVMAKLNECQEFLFLRPRVEAIRAKLLSFVLTEM